jgi:hypothetical protein
MSSFLVDDSGERNDRSCNRRIQMNDYTTYRDLIDGIYNENQSLSELDHYGRRDNHSHVIRIQIHILLDFRFS